MTDWIGTWANLLPDQVAVKEAETGRELTYGQLDRMGQQFAGLLTDQFGLVCGDRVAVLAEWCLELVGMFSAAQKAGLILVPLNYRLAAPELAWQLQDSGATLLLASERLVDLMQNASEQSVSLPVAVLEDLPEKAAEYDFPEALRLDENHPVFLLYTSGTTGRPKGAIYSHKMLFWNSINTAMGLLVHSEARTINCMPPFHTGGWNVLLTPLLHHGGYSCLMKKFDAGRILELIQSERPTLFMGVPTMLSMMAAEAQFADCDLSSLHYIIVGGEPMPVPLIETYHRKGISIRQGYGMTEVGPNLTSLHQNDAIRKRGSIGKPNVYVEVRIMKDELVEADRGEAGELWIRGPMVTPGYWGNPQATAESREGDWFKTGDMALMDEEGYLFIVDRIKNMFISGGENVYPAEVERVLLRHEAITEAAVVGVPDPKWGETGAALIVVSENMEIDHETIRSFCRNHLAGFKVPRHVIQVAEIPKNDAGKIDRKELKQLACSLV